MAKKRPSRAVLFLTILAAPVALGFETLLRLLLFPRDFEYVRELFEPVLTPVAWALGAVAAVASLLGVVVQRSLAQKRIEKSPDRDDEDARYRNVFGVFLLTSSIPQIPAIFSTFAFMFGASLLPVLVGIAVCSVGVVTQALRVPALARKLC
ncbi:MAG TPA: hypothetical protein VIL20_23215 [Sandaracinaceae bacterium]